MIFKKSPMYNIIWIVVFKILIELAFIYIISENYSVFDDVFNLSNYIISWALLFTSYFIINKIISNKRDRTSTLLLYIIYLFSYIPGISLWSLQSLSNTFILYFNIYWFHIFILMLLYSKLMIPSMSIKINLEVRKYIFAYIFLVSVAYGVFYSYKFSGLRIHFNLFSVYSIRDTGSNASTLEGLLYYIVSTIVYPLYAIYFYKKKKWFVFATAVFMELLMFSVAGHKFYFFIIPIGIIAYHLYNDQFAKYIPKLLSLFIAIGFVENVLLKSWLIISYSVRRVLYIPALLDSYYFEFFMENSPVYFSQDKVLRRLGLVSPYSTPVSKVIGDIYMDGANTNTGLFGDAFSNLGVYSVVVYPIIFIFAMILIDFITNHIPKSYYITVLVSMVMVLLNNEISGIFYNYIIPLSLLFLFLDYELENEEIVDKGLERQDA